MGSRFLDVENPILRLGVTELVKSFKEKTLSPLEYAKALIARIAELDGELNSFVYFSPEALLEEAKVSEARLMKGGRRGALEGLPVSYKDMIFSKGIPTTCSAAFLKDFLPDYDATLMKNLKAAGSLMQGKVNTQFFALGSRGELGCHGRAKNPYDTAKITGGSSSGSAAAVAAYLSPASIGSDSGGSARIPPSLCGVVGMKPTYGRVSCYGIWPQTYHFDTPCPITRSVEDNALILSEMVGWDVNDPMMPAGGREDYLAGLKDGVAGMTVGICDGFESPSIANEIAACYEGWIRFFETQGAKIKKVSLSAEELNEYRAAHQLVEMGDSYSVHEDYMRRFPEAYPEAVFKRVQAGNVPCALYSRAEYKVAQGNRAVSQALSEVDLFLSPTVPIPATDLDVLEIRADKTGDMKSVSTALCDYAWLANHTGMPAISVPGGVTKDGLSIGAMIMGKSLQAQAVYRAAYLLEQSQGGRR